MKKIINELLYDLQCGADIREVENMMEPAEFLNLVTQIAAEA